MTPSLAEMRTSFKQFLRYLKISEAPKIARRYFALNSFDGIMTVLGVLLGGFAGHLQNPDAILLTGLGACIAMGISGFWGAHEAEATERAIALKELESATLEPLEDTDLSKAHLAAIWLITGVNTLSPSVAGAIILIPFFLPLSINQMFLFSFAIAFLALLLLGGYLGKISERDILKSGIKMVVAGLAVAIVSWLILWK